MATKTPKQTKKKPTKAAAEPAAESQPIEAPGGAQFHATREVIESVAVAFVLAFLFRTFVAEAFVIPTGSMSPALQGQHMDVDCAKCGYRYRVTASNENPDDMPHMFRQQPELAQTVGGMCPMCRYVMPFRSDVPGNLLEDAGIEADEVEAHTSYPGDRIVVSKFGFDFADPERWDVVVFKFPGNGNINYIKRLTGLPGDKLRIYQGDVYVKTAEDDDFQLARRPAHTIEAMLQPVHDTRYEPAQLHNAGWPMRWAATTADGWQCPVEPAEPNVQQSFTVDAEGDDVAWLRYRHLVPHEDDWLMASLVGRDEAPAQEKADWLAGLRPELITDFNPYNARLQRSVARSHGWRIMSQRSPHFQGSTGYCWVGDLAVECDVNVVEARGEIVLEVVESGLHLRVAIALDSGVATCSIVDGRTGAAADFSASGQTALDAPGNYKLRMANVDDELHLWVDGAHIDLGDARWDPVSIVGDRKELIPWTSPGDEGDQGDLAPAGVGARGAKLTIDRLAVLRDIYYIAAKYTKAEPQAYSTAADYPVTGGALGSLMAKPSEWGRFRRRDSVEFSVGEDQFFVMGDNSPESLDARVWTDARPGRSSPGSVPGGNYVDRELLIGRAVAVFWPHSWGSIPGLPWLPGFPNFGDMRLVR